MRDTGLKTGIPSEWRLDMEDGRTERLQDVLRRVNEKGILIDVDWKRHEMRSEEDPERKNTSDQDEWGWIIRLVGPAD